MNISNIGSMISTRDAVIRCGSTIYMCPAVSSCGVGNDTATINAESYEAVKGKYS